ncbi:MotA/TolQ/ExbB proton channel family protein [Verrucomicrobiota bacterium]
MKKLLLAIVFLGLIVMMGLESNIYAQDDGAAAPAADPAPAVAADPEVGAGAIVTEHGEAVAQTESKRSGGFFHVIIGSGALGVILWLAIFGAAGTFVYFAVDCAITVRAKKIMPDALIANVTNSMAEGDVLKALQNCESEPGALANILTSGFSHVEEGFDVIQDSISTAADLETEKIMQKLTWLSVIGNLAPMLGLLGTVQGMILAFKTLGLGAPDIGALATNISQALYTTAAGLTIAVPCVAVYYTFRNSANRIILKMEAMTMELIKDLRNVEVVEE